MDSITESSLISRLQTSDYENLHSQFSHFFKPFHDFIDLPNNITEKKKKKKNDGKKTESKKAKDQSQIRPLAKQFLPFLSRLLKILPDCLSGEEDQENATELFTIYKLALDCLTCISPCLSGKPYFVHLQRVHLLHCLEGCGRYDEAEREGFSILDEIRSVISSPFALKAKGKVDLINFYLPELTKENADSELAISVVRTVVCLIRCASKIRSKDGGSYSKVLALVNQVAPWLGVLDSDAFDKYHRLLVGNLYHCALFMAGESHCFDADLVHSFCLTTLAECLKSSRKDWFSEFARRICSSLSLEWEGRTSLVLEILRCTLESMACECKVNMVYVVNEFLDFVCYFSNSCRSASAYVCEGVVRHLKEMTSDFLQVLTPLSSILSLYTAGFYFMHSDVQARESNSITGEGVSTILMLQDNGENLQYLAASLGYLANCFHNSSSCNEALSKNLREVSSLALASNFQVSNACKREHRDISLLSYINALHFLCKPFAEYVNSAWKHMVSEKTVPFSSNISYVRDAFHQFCDAFLSGLSNTSGKERDKLLEMRRTLFCAATAAFRIALKTDGSTQKSMDCIDRVIFISREWVQPSELKFLISSLYNVGVSLYNIKLWEQASVALELCYRALWTHVPLLCQQFSDKAEGIFDDNLSEDAIIDFVTDACAKTAVYLDVLHHCRHSDMNKIIVNSLLNWYAASNLFKKLTGPVVLVKQWVKIICEDFADDDAADNAPSLHSLLLPDCITWPKTTMGVLLEQELLSYAEMKVRNPSLCQRMQLKVINILLEDTYVSKDYFLQRSRVLVRKGKILRACGFDGLNDCIQCLSEAISVLKDPLSEPASSTVLCHQLALTYCLHALCLQEADPKSEVILHDIRCALKLLSIINTSSDHSSNDQSELVARNAILLLYHIADLLSLKGYLHFQYDIYNLIIILYKLQNVPLEDCLAMFWRDRRLNHALCTSPIDEDFIMTLSQQFGVDADSIDYWISCIEGFSVSLLGFCLKFFLSDSIFDQVRRNHLKRSVAFEFTVEKIKEAASVLILSDSAPNHSAFLAGYLYYDLSERLLSNGRLYEALSCANEALRLRAKLLKRKFIFSYGQQSAKGIETTETTLQNERDHVHLEAIGSVITEVWPDITKPQDLEVSILSPWNVLKCYLESTLQVGIINESIGNGAEAEAFLLVGNKISCLQDLPLFRVAFASSLGRIYCKKQLWDLAENELDNAKKILAGSDTIISCKRCKLTLEVNIDLQKGDLARTRFDITKGDQSLKNSSFAVDLYRSALEKLNLVDLGNPLAIYEESNTDSSKFSKSFVKEADYGVNNTCEGVQKAVDDGSKKPKKSKNASTHVPQKKIWKAERSSRTTRSTNRSCHSNSQLSSVADFGCDEMKAGSMHDIIYLKWEFYHRRLALRLLMKIGKCTGRHGEIHEVHKIFSQSISLLFNREPLCQISSNIVDMLELIGKENPGDIFAVERAAILYNLSWFSVKNCLSVHSRIQCCCLSDIQIPRVVSWLLRAFILCRELPLLFQKVSRLLAVIFLLSTSAGPFSLPIYSGKALSASHWAGYFHQASLGTYLHHQNLFSTSGKFKSYSFIAFEGSHITGSADIVLEELNSLRFAPEKLEDLEGFVNNFFASLPSVTVICLSLLGGAYGSLLGEILLLSPDSPAWMLLSRLNSKREPVVMILPVDFIPEETEHDDSSYGMGSVSEWINSTEKWICPWGSTVVDDVAPQFKLILEDNYLSLKTSPPSDTQKNRYIWWVRRTKLNDRLDKFLRDMEDLWLGPWRCLLLGERSNSEYLDAVLVKLMDDLKRKCKFDANESHLKVIIGGTTSVAESEECVEQLLLYKGYFGRGGCSGKARFRSSSSSPDGVADGVCGLPHQLILEAIGELAEEVDREPIVLVLDADIQMLPWESLPIIRKQEVYRMPSVSSIGMTFNKISLRQERFGRVVDNFPSVNPLDAYYLLNPSGDLSDTQVAFEEWFRNQKWEGKAGNFPTTKELALALESHDLFIYFGHGSGMQYISGREIQKLNQCAATLLMGCSSGTLSFTGCYAPKGAPLSYLLAGSPAIVANLWEVTDKDIDRFGKVMLDAWLQEGSTHCSKCNEISKELKCMNIRDEGNVKAPKTRRKALAKGKKLQEVYNSEKCKDCTDKLRIATFMGRARDACRLPLLIGAAPVCYGVPTFIRKKVL
ncbi:separase isoform X2 [Tasmannia lanceolata]|uniref:separase isoform X2 n=1 Tax=Tasmannia lanceolata TaxID=3420 RepID=UPI00406370ED